MKKQFLLQHVSALQISRRLQMALDIFPIQFYTKLNNAEVESYLNDVAERVNKSGESISLTGHTDDVGSDVSNLSLGRKRAEIVKSYLLGQGVNASKIQIDSKGESVPVAENTSEDGRAKNRRTELKIIK
ncbi:MAG: OmpA family protein [Saprospiraceae bacterium]|nr:OmpA family protein [Saprospiraceae bacterium]